MTQRVARTSMFSIAGRSVILAGCLLGGIACTAGSRPAVESAEPRPATRFGDLNDVVFAGEGDSQLYPATGFVRYPDGERSRGVEAAFAVAFVLDPTGRPEYDTVSFIGYAAPAFYSEICRFLSAARYEPVHRDGRVRRAFVVADFTFTLEPQNVAEPRVHVQPVNVARLRRTFVAKGLPESAKELEMHHHCR